MVVITIAKPHSIKLGRFLLIQVVVACCWFAMVKTSYTGLVALSLVCHFTRFYMLQQKYFKEKDNELHRHRQLNQIPERFPLIGAIEEGMFAQNVF